MKSELHQPLDAAVAILICSRRQISQLLMPHATRLEVVHTVHFEVFGSGSFRGHPQMEQPSAVEIYPGSLRRCLHILHANRKPIPRRIWSVEYDHPSAVLPDDTPQRHTSDLTSHVSFSAFPDCVLYCLPGCHVVFTLSHLFTRKQNQQTGSVTVGAVPVLSLSGTRRVRIACDRYQTGQCRALRDT